MRDGNGGGLAASPIGPSDSEPRTARPRRGHSQPQTKKQLSLTPNIPSITPSALDMKLLARLCDDIDASPSVRQFLQADPSRLPIWLKFNKVEAPANKAISEWLERFWYDAHASFSLDAPAAGPLSVRYQNQSIAKINPDGSLDIGPSVHNFVLPVDGADIRHISPDGSSAILHRDGQARILQCACFPAGTLVHTPGGTVAIESLKPDDLIMAYDTQTRDTVISQVRQVAKKTWYSLVRVVTPSDTIWATPNHPFYIPALGRYLPADSLRRGVQLLALTGALLTVQGVAAVDTTVSVYNFEVADHHNYYVGSEGVLVHNTNGNCPLRKANLRGEGFDHAALALDIPQQGAFREFLAALPDDHALWGFFRGLDPPPAAGVSLEAAQVGRVKAWAVVKNTGFSTDVSWLTRIDNWLAGGTDGAKISKLVNEIDVTPNLKSAFENNEVNFSSWQRIEDGTPTFKTNNPTGYLTCMKKMTLYDNTAGGTGNIKYYRVQTDHPNSQLLTVEPNGDLIFNDKSSELYFSTDNMDHAIYYTTGQGVNIDGVSFNVYPPPRPGGTIIEFEVPKWLDDQLKSASIPQHKATTNPLNNSSPQIVDYVQPGNPFGIKENWQTLIEDNYIQGSAIIIE